MRKTLKTQSNEESKGLPKVQEMKVSTKQVIEEEMNPAEKSPKTKIAAEILFDPMGAVPKWVVNFVQKAWPVNTLNGLRELMNDETFETNNQVIQFIKHKER